MLLLHQKTAYCWSHWSFQHHSKRDSCSAPWFLWPVISACIGACNNYLTPLDAKNSSNFGLSQLSIYVNKLTPHVKLVNKLYLIDCLSLGGRETSCKYSPLPHPQQHAGFVALLLFIMCAFWANFPRYQAGINDFDISLSYKVDIYNISIH